MKKIISLVMSAAMLLAMAACGTPAASQPQQSSAPEATKAPEAAAATTQEAPKQQATKPSLLALGKKPEEIKVGCIFIGTVGDEGYTFAHNQGVEQMTAATGVKAVIVENVPENADSLKSMRDLIDQGCNVIIANSFGFGPFVHELSDEFPEVIFLHCSGAYTNTNMSAFFGRIYQARYLSGIAAGLKTQSKIGYVAAMPIPEVVRGINAFTLGVRSVNPQAEVEVIWTNTWYDPAVEKSAAMELLNKGCDVIAEHQDTTAPQIAAQEKGAFCIGYNSATPNAAPKAYLTAPIWNWGVYYTKVMNQILDGSWQSENFWGGYESGMIALDTLTDLNAPEAKEKVAAAEAMLKAATSEMIFKGPIKDNEGVERIAEGQVLTDGEMLSINWFVEGVIGSVPKN